MSEETLHTYVDVQSDDLPDHELKWLNEGIEKLNVSLEAVAAVESKIEYQPAKQDSTLELAPHKPKDEYLTYHATLYDMRYEDSEGILSWLYSLTHKSEWNPDQMIQTSELFCVLRDLHHHLYTLTKCKTSFDRKWVKSIIRKLRFVADIYFHESKKYTGADQELTWGNLLLACSTADEEYLEISRQNIFVGMVHKKRIPTKPESGWEHLPPSTGKNWESAVV